ncbi:aspartate kinase [Enterococcus pseudoavium]|uniref:Aspartokinase n=1 Tax=Enterococcus pseudoavium TaxID=44007 RepID=A0AAE4I4H4_9ENTE|nr:aspartate kinase [Enterococcus pseudoavium]MDT2737805.1 aspartate kinase [Enterococcus pseudoavium]MDT2754687.1 aspartate kinase [Enterococcus pseudoavium]MDT2771775.1 aspartate kinase [Enterococcus pseudoavium]
MKVIKFGGSSVASAEQLKKVLAIVTGDSGRRFVVVSAPGKRNNKDKKVTDLLIRFYNAVLYQQDTEELIQEIVARYTEIAAAFHLDNELGKLFYAELKALQEKFDPTDPYALDSFLASGENLNAQLIAACFQKKGVNARYVNPRELGITVSNEPQNARILAESYEKIYQWRDSEEILIIPGFFGYTKDGHLCTFSRGGSDISGSIIAAGMKVDLYENFTDVDGIFAASPKYIHEPELIEYATYREIRELTYAGFTVFHDEALMPAFKAQIPVIIKNTNNPDCQGTLIKKDFNCETRNEVVGVASDDGFCGITIGKYLLNREVGIVRRILQILEDLNIGFEHMPSGIDDISIILRERQLTRDIEAELMKQIEEKIQPDQLSIEHGLSVVALVGEGMRERPGTTSDSTAALARKNVNLRMISQGADERSIIFAIRSEQERLAVRSLYYTFFD